MRTGPLLRAAGILLLSVLSSGSFRPTPKNGKEASGEHGSFLLLGAVAAEADVEVEVGSKGGSRRRSCTPVLEPMPDAMLAPLGKRVGKLRGLALVFVVPKNSPWWCGRKGSITAAARKFVRSGSGRSKFPAGAFVADARSSAVRAAFGITRKNQVPAVARVDLDTGRRYIVRADGDAEFDDLKSAPLDGVLEVLDHPKPLDLFDITWYDQSNQLHRGAVDAETDISRLFVVVPDRATAKRLVKDGLRRVAQRHGGEARVMLTRNTRDFGFSEQSLPAVLADIRGVGGRSTVQRYGRIESAARVEEIIRNDIVKPRTLFEASDLHGRNFSGRFHRVSWSPQLYVMDGFLTPEECKAMIENARPTLSSGSLVGDNIDRRIKDASFTVVPEETVTDVERRVITRLHDAIRIPEANGEILQVSEYLPGQKYTLHPDTIDSSPGPHSMERIVTFLMYLNDVEEAGETVFIRANGKNQHVSRHDTQPWNLRHYCARDDILKIEPRAGRAIFWYNHHTDLTWDQNTLHGACHVGAGVKYVSQRWVRWHTRESMGSNPLQHNLDRASQLQYQVQQLHNRVQSLERSQDGDHSLQQERRISGLEEKLRRVEAQLRDAEGLNSDLALRVRDLGDPVPTDLRPVQYAATWRTWVEDGSMFFPVQSIAGKAWAEIYGKAASARLGDLPERMHDLRRDWSEGYQRLTRWTVVQNPYARLVNIYHFILSGGVGRDIDKVWKKRLETLGSFREFVVGPIRMYHAKMSPTAGGDIGRHPSTQPQTHSIMNGDEMAAHYTLHFESIADDMERLCRSGVLPKRVCASRSTGSWFGGGEEEHDRVLEYLSDKRVNLWEIVNKAFDSDFRSLGYQQVTNKDEYDRVYRSLRADPIVRTDAPKQL